MKEAVIGWAVPFLLGGLAALLLKQWQQLRALKAGLCALLRDSLLKIYQSCEAKGCCAIVERENIKSLYEQYHKLGGNGTITSLVSKLDAMPTHAPTQP